MIGAGKTCMTASGELQFLDTDILVYAHDISAGAKHIKAVELVQGCWELQTGCTSLQVLEEFYLAVTGKVSRPLDEGTAAGILRDLSYWRVHTPRPGDLLNAIDLQEQYNLAFRDAMIVQSAAGLGCEVIWSEGISPDGVYAGVKVINPFRSKS